MSRHPSIYDPSDLRQLGIAELAILAQEMRQIILSVCLQNGGHLGASLGAVEIAIALHFVFESPRESIVWDVGHQAYAHKLLTGRWDRFSTLRLEGGLSGFLSRDESVHDAFGAGHSSTSLSAALGIARAKRMIAKQSDFQNASQTPQEPWTVAVIGDGGLTSGIAFEALNNLRETDVGPFLIVVNDNQMSISKNTGAMPAILAGSHAGEYFTQFGCEYHGPVDGHDLAALIRLFTEIQQRRDETHPKPTVVHLLTQKGKGYAPAEELPASYHGVSPVQEKTPGSAAKKAQKTYSDVLGASLTELADRDPRVVAITAAMKEGTGLSAFADRHPSRFHDVGIAEAHATTFAAGLAAGGAKPVVCIYSTFLQRALDSIIHDVCLQRLPVVFAIDRAGVVGPDGPTHHGAFDMAYLGAIPGIRISSPSCLSDLPVLIERAHLSSGPWAIRYPRGAGPEGLAFPLEGFARFHSKSAHPKLVAVALGPAAVRAETARLALGPLGSLMTLVSTVDAKPIPSAVIDYLKTVPEAALLTIEDGVIRGGFGEALLGEITGHQGRREHAGFSDAFLPHAQAGVLEHLAGVSAQALERKMRALLEH